MPTEADFDEMVASGRAYLTPKADAALGVPVGCSPDNIFNVRVNVISLDEANPAPPVSFLIDGKGDPIIQQVMARYAGAMGADRNQSAEDRLNATQAAFYEIAALKQKQAALDPPAPPPPEAVPLGEPLPIDPATIDPSVIPARPPFEAAMHTTPPPAEPVAVKFDLGEGFGQELRYYSDVVLAEDTLALVSDARTIAAGGMFIPPVSDPPRPLTVAVAGLSQPIRAYATGMQFTHRGHVYCLLVVDRDN